MNTNLTNSIYLIDEKGKKRLLQRLLVLMLFLLYWQFGSLPVTFSDIAIIVSAWFVVFTCLYPFYSNAFLYVLYLINFTFNDFIFSITHSGFNQKIITHILDIVFITRSHIFLSEIHLKFVMGFLVFIFLIGLWSVGRWTVHLVGG